MANKPTHDLVVKIGSYIKDGETKNRTLKIGSVFKSETGAFLLLDRHVNLAGIANPDNRDSVMVSLYSVRDNNSYGQPKAPVAPVVSEQEDDIPF